MEFVDWPLLTGNPGFCEGWDPQNSLNAGFPPGGQSNGE
jgi:hypothetical protein